MRLRCLSVLYEILQTRKKNTNFFISICSFIIKITTRDFSVVEWTNLKKFKSAFFLHLQNNKNKTSIKTMHLFSQ